MTNPQENRGPDKEQLVWDSADTRDFLMVNSEILLRYLEESARNIDRSDWRSSEAVWNGSRLPALIDLTAEEFRDSVDAGTLQDVATQSFTDLSTLATANERDSTPAPLPPKSGEMMLHLIVPAELLECVLGDLQEAFGSTLRSSGIKKAVRQYYGQCLRSLPALTLQRFVGLLPRRLRSML